MGEACFSSEQYTAVSPPVQVAGAPPQQGRDWYVLKVRTGGEPMAVAALTQRGFCPYFPTQKVQRRYSDRIKVVNSAVFPGYIFCQFDLRQRKLAVISCPGVDYIVGFAEAPTAVPEAELMHIMRMIGAGACGTRSLVQGQRVRVKQGPLKGVEGILLRHAEGDRLVVSIELLGQGACLRITQDEVSAIEGDS